MANKFNQPIHAGVGTSSIIMIFLVLCLTAFGILSLSAASSSEKITEKNIAYVSEYYNASSCAQEYIAELSAKGVPGEYKKSFNFSDEMSLNIHVDVHDTGDIEIISYTVDTASNSSTTSKTSTGTNTWIPEFTME